VLHTQKAECQKTLIAAKPHVLHHGRGSPSLLYNSFAQGLVGDSWCSSFASLLSGVYGCSMHTLLCMSTQQHSPLTWTHTNTHTHSVMLSCHACPAVHSVNSVMCHACLLFDWVLQCPLGFYATRNNTRDSGVAITQSKRPPTTCGRMCRSDSYGTYTGWLPTGFVECILQGVYSHAHSTQYCCYAVCHMSRDVTPGDGGKVGDLGHPAQQASSECIQPPNSPHPHPEGTSADTQPC
jgi:hypothetical protein